MKSRKKYLRYRAKMRKLQKIGTVMKWACPICGERTFFYDNYDAECCFKCNVWFSSICGDKACPFCGNRPSSPSEALFYENFNDSCRKDYFRQNYQHQFEGALRHQRKRQRMIMNNGKQR